MTRWQYCSVVGVLYACKMFTCIYIEISNFAIIKMGNPLTILSLIKHDKLM